MVNLCGTLIIVLILQRVLDLIYDGKQNKKYDILDIMLTTIACILASAIMIIVILQKIF